MGSKDIDPHEVTSAEPARPGKMAAGLPIGGYSIEEVLGEGGMGVVWSAHDPNLDRRLAIKVLKRTDAAPSLRKRLLREARAMARLKHPNVLTVYEVGTERDRDFIAMELVEGGTLDEWLDRQPPRDEVMKAVLAAGRGLAAAHAAGLVHRDFKPHNVLRSKEGRVLVTDFGLARGLGEESGSGLSQVPAEAALDVTIASPAKSSDSLLDSPLTQTGAMVGTPAYMAPEQFRGAAPDPRTDQFAFCVTAWQALTGGRPFTGSSIDELRIAASAGTSPTLKVDLPPAVRAALARGLDPDPAKRWPTLDDLLETLDDAVRPRRPRWIVPAVMLALIGLFALTVMIARRGPKSVPVGASECAPGEDPFAEAWSPTVRTDLMKTISGRGIELGDAGFARIADPLDAYRDRWRQLFATACAAPEKIGPRQRACLLGARDQTSALVLILREGQARMYSKIDLHGMLPELGACSGDNPTALPHPPTDPQLRAKVVRLMAKAFALTGSPEFMAQYPGVEEEARTLDWPPMLPIIQMGIGNELLRRRDYAAARTMMRKIIDAPVATRDGKTVAVARFGLLEASLNELEQPRSDAKPGELHDELERLLIYARKEVKLTGDPSLVAALAGFEARAQEGLAQWKRHAPAYDEAIAQARKAVSGYQAAGDLKRAARLAAMVAELLVLRDGAHSLDDAMFAARTADEALIQAKLDPEPGLDSVRAWIEEMRGEYVVAQGLYTRNAGPPPPPRGPEHTGVVVDARGKPIANARIVAWRGTLVGDPKNLVIDPDEVDGDRAESGAGGTFTVHAEPGDAVIAELADLRSAPQTVGTGALTLELEPTTQVMGTIDRPNLADVWISARYTAGTNLWEVRVPARGDRSFQLVGLPHGTPQIATVGTAAQGQRRVIAGPGANKVVWPLGQAIEVIVRGDVERDATTWVFSEQTTPRTRAEAEALAARSAEVAWATLTPIGADNTDAGRAIYAPGDRHAVISGSSDGEVSVCVARQAANASPVVCQQLVIGQTYDPIEPGEAPRGVAVTPVIFADGDRGKPTR
ncbi:hypothetical protein BH11MYX3_BH11MYX3_19780 [soil metagenome]